LCHEGYYNSPAYNQNDVYRLVKEKLYIDTKKDKELYKKTKDNLPKAITNAKRISESHIRNGIELISIDSTPSTQVFQIIEIIDEFR